MKSIGPFDQTITVLGIDPPWNLESPSCTHMEIIIIIIITIIVIIISNNNSNNSNNNNNNYNNNR